VFCSVRLCQIHPASMYPAARGPISAFGQTWDPGFNWISFEHHIVRRVPEDMRHGPNLRSPGSQRLQLVVIIHDFGHGCSHIGPLNSPPRSRTVARMGRSNIIRRETPTTLNSSTHY